MKITYKDTTIDVPKGTKIMDIFTEQIKESKRDIIGCRYNNEVKSLDYVVKDDGIVELIDGTNKDGKRIYTRGLIYIMSKAFFELYPKALITVSYQLSNSVLCEIENMKIYYIYLYM